MKPLTKLPFFGFFLVTAFALSASAETELTIEGARIRLSEVSDGYDDGELATLDLGPAPPPGNSRLLSRGEVEDQLHAAGDDAKSLHMPAVLRVKSAAKRWSTVELNDAVRPRLLAALPIGVKLESSKLNRGIVTSPAVTIGAARFPRIPKREGETTLTATVDVTQDGVTVMRVPVNVVVMVTELATRPAVARGSRLNLVIEHGAARVTALAVALSDIELGDSGLFRVASTQRVLRARLLTADTAQVIE